MKDKKKKIKNNDTFLATYSRTFQSLDESCSLTCKELD